MNVDELNINYDTEIDPDNLDVALVELPNLLFKYSQASTEAEKKVEEAEENVKITRSRLIKWANENPKELEGGKATGQAVEAYYRTEQEYIDAKQEEIDARYEASMVKNAIYAIYAKRGALEHLIKLLGMEYFSGPSSPMDLSDRVDIAREEAKGRIQASLSTVTPKRSKAASKKRSKKTPRR